MTTTYPQQPLSEINWLRHVYSDKVKQYTKHNFRSLKVYKAYVMLINELEK